MIKPSIAILGTGSWGSALAMHLAHNDCQVSLWSYFAEEINQIAQFHENREYLPGMIFPDNVNFESNLTKCITGKSIVFIMVPSHAFEQTVADLKKILPLRTIVCWGTKGLVKGKFLNQIAAEILGKDFPFVSISGPSFAAEVAKQLPTALCVASNNPSSAMLVAECLRSATFRPYLSNDMQGVAIGGTLKNILAIAVGISDGLGFGANARAALITRGLLEMKILGQQLGAKEETFNGLSGLGDLILTATDNQSRNRRFGIALGKGLEQQQAKTQIKQVIEGARNAEEIYHLAQKLHINLPICNLVYQIIYQKLEPNTAVAQLLDRPIKTET